jgi:hypothetical protein
MKWSDRTAQGFNPGLAGNKDALKVASEILAPESDHQVEKRVTCVGRHFQGEFW